MDLLLTNPEQGLVVLELPQEQPKIFHLSCGSYDFASYDTIIPVFHKRTYKAVSFKDVGQKMTVFAWHAKRNFMIDKEDVKSHIAYALGLFSSFDEESGSHQYFLYRYSAQKVAVLMEKLRMLSLDMFAIHMDAGYALVSGMGSNRDTSEYLLSLESIFALVLVYGSLQKRGEELVSLKLHIPAFGQFTDHIERIRAYVHSLRNQGIYIDHQTTDSDEGQILELVINDYEVLEKFVSWYKPIESFIKITKKDWAERHREGLFTFLASQGVAPAMIEKLQSGVIKPLITTG